jgi:hypothetical protein
MAPFFQLRPHRFLSLPGWNRSLTLCSRFILLIPRSTFYFLLSIPAPSEQFARLTDALPKELQTRFELGFRIRAPHLSPTQSRLQYQQYQPTF